MRIIRWFQYCQRDLKLPRWIVFLTSITFLCFVASFLPVDDAGFTALYDIGMLAIVLMLCIMVILLVRTKKAT